MKIFVKMEFEVENVSKIEELLNDENIQIVKFKIKERKTIKEQLLKINTDRNQHSQAIDYKFQNHTYNEPEE